MRAEIGNLWIRRSDPNQLIRNIGNAVGHHLLPSFCSGVLTEMSPVKTSSRFSLLTASPERNI
jgi:hypothetical protein